jgi:hypothetical protein
MTNDDHQSKAFDQEDTASGTLRAGTLVIRKWTEPHQVEGFRARLTYSDELEDEPKTFSSADPNEILAIVGEWLLAQSGPIGTD